MAINKSSRSILYGCAGVFFILLAIAMKQNVIGWHPYGNSSRAIQQIRKAINENALEVKSEMVQVKAQILRNELTFSSIIQSIRHPAFVYKNGDLAYWNNNKFIPDPLSLNIYGSQQLLVTPNGKFLVFREMFNSGDDHYVLIELLRLTFRYPFSNEYLRQGLNSDIFLSGNIKVNSIRSDNNFYSGDGMFLFSIDFSELPQDNTKSLLCFLVGFIFLIIAFGRILLQTKRVLGFDYSLLMLVGGLGVFGIFIFNAPAFLIDTNSPTQEVNSSFKLIYISGISVGILSVLIFIFRYGLESEIMKRFLRTQPSNFLYVFILIVLNTALLIILYEFSLALYGQEATSINIKKLFYPGKYIFIAAIDFIILSVNYFLSGHIVSRFLQHNINRIKYKSLIWTLVLAVLFFLIAGYFFSFLWFTLFVFNLGYLVLVYKLKLASTLGRIRYVTYIYFFACAIICSMSAAIAFGVSDQLRMKENSRKIAIRVVREEKLVDEKLFNEVSMKIGHDRFIAEIVRNPLSDKKLVEQKIKKYYLADVIDKYDVRAYIYDNEGRSIDDNSTRNYFSIYKSINNREYKTSFKNVFKQRGANSGYFCPLIVKQEGQLEGYILIELKLRKVIPYSIFPALLLEKGYGQVMELNHISYAVYDKGSLVSSFGDFNYFKDFKKLVSDESKIISNGEIRGGKFHQLFSFPEDREVLVSTDNQLLKDTFSNFSFLFLVLALLLAGIILSNTFYYKLRQVSSTFTTKIQLFINFAFFIPLLVVCMCVFYIISYSYKEELQKDFINKAEAISNRLMLSFNEIGPNKLTEENIVEGLNESARFSQTDINLYDTKGKLIASTQPKIFEFSILSNYINPEAIKDLIENKEMYALIPEQIGTLSFNTVYYKIKSYNTGEMLGTLAIPYFGSDKEIQSKILEALVVVLNVFTVIFILFLVASFFASRLLTAPLSLLTNKIKQTSLNKDNDPLVYNANDEIGLLVNEYNRMLLKMDDSKKALSASEKEAAWREMAKQVAHEIKNPLTPMKLTLQNLQRMIKSDNPNTKELTEHSITILLDQIENLNDIAGSFSAFTQMPLPKLERFEIGTLLSKSVFLFNSKEDTIVSIDIDSENFIIEGDEKLMNRVFINLLTNAFDAVSEEGSPMIKVSLHKNSDKVLIEISDNGKGIPAEYINKVFQPNFSTKTSGSGIGLAVAKRGVEQMGGKIWFTTMINKGTCFYIEMPLVQS